MDPLGSAGIDQCAMRVMWVSGRASGPANGGGRQAGWRNGQAGRPVLRSVLQIQMFIEQPGLKHKIVLNAPLYESRRAVLKIQMFRTGRSKDPNV